MSRRKSEYGPADAKLLSEAEPKLTSRQLGAKLGVSHNTINRWKKNGWKLDSAVVAPTVEIETQKKAVRAATKKVTDEDLMVARLAMMNADVSVMGEAELLKETARRTLVTVCTALEFTRANAAELVKNKPRDVGVLLVSCGQAVAHAHEGWDRYLEVLRGVRGEAAPEVATVASKMDEDDPMREVMARLEASANARKKAAEAVPGPKSVQ